MRELVILLCFPIQQALAHVLVSTASHKEHKVHNIVLYPDKHSWCKTTPIKQVITHPGCKSVEIDNNVCVGACFSYSIPKTEPITTGEVVPYCDSCQPTVVIWKHVVLECPDSDYEEDNVMTKRVEMIDQCACASCKQATSDSTTTKTESQDPKSDVPELMSLMLETHKAKVEEVTLENETGEMSTERPAIALKKLENSKEGLYLEALQEIRSKIDQEDYKLDEREMSALIENMKAEQKPQESFESQKFVSNSSELAHNHPRHHRVPGPHHSMVYAEYSPDIAAELYYDSLKTKPTTQLPASNANESPSEERVEDNLIVIEPEKKLKLEQKMEEQR
uniref:Neuroblastoma suppressor of tumorigenicity 1 n=1 Tax=Cacopsylla melanoneura TaxID=428564 RepID=A0A8D8SNJ9_9HEMI